MLATGSVKKPIPGLEFGGNVIGTEEAWALNELPGSMVVIGAGASGTEIASAYARLGTQVTLYEGLERVLPTEDADISKLAERSFKKQGIDVKTATFYEGQEADWVVIAAGRAPDVEGLGLDAAGVKLDEHGLIAVDGALRTNVPKVYAIGDLVARARARPQGVRRGRDRRRGRGGREDAPDLVHRHPARDVLHTERRLVRADRAAGQGRRARRRGRQGPVRRGRRGDASTATAPAWSRSSATSKYGEMLGGHIVGAKATELIQELVNAKVLEGGFPEVARMIHGHPTMSEAVMEAARAADGWLIHG